MKKIRGLFSGRKILIPILLVIVLIAAVAGFYLYSQPKAKNKPNPTAVVEIKDLTKKVGKLIELPGNEAPTIATVSDITKLRDQPFFAKAQNGDKVLVYQKAKKAILFRPGENKIIEVAVYNAPVTAITSPTPTQASQAVKVALYNGTTTVGLTKTIEASLVKKYPSVVVVGKENASRSDYKKTIVVELVGNSQMAQTLATEFGGEVGSLPSGETRPTGADILVILGKAQ